MIEKIFKLNLLECLGGNSSGAHAAGDAHSHKGVKVEPQESQRHIRVVRNVTYVPVR